MNPLQPPRKPAPLRVGREIFRKPYQTRFSPIGGFRVDFHGIPMIDLTYTHLEARAHDKFRRSPCKVYGVPNGGTYAALLVAKACQCEVIETPEPADVIVDDIVDSGATREQWMTRFPDKPFFALVDKTDGDRSWAGMWVSFPWERARREDGPQDAVKRILQFIGEDPDREGLRETPDRVVRSYGELFGGYKQKPEDVLKVFEDGACDEMVVLRNCEVHSFCEHHLLPFFGTAHIAYVPDKRVIGVSKLARILDIYARRLQIQERLCQQVTAALDTHLKPRGSACIIEAVHSCMTCRGVGKQHCELVTSSLTGVFRDLPVRQEFLSLVRG